MNQVSRSFSGGLLNLPVSQTQSPWPPIRCGRVSRLACEWISSTVSPTLAVSALSPVSAPTLPLKTICDGVSLRMTSTVSP
ncbi:hypothetical protein D3C72_2297490 [compost metagenome]